MFAQIYVGSIVLVTQGSHIGMQGQVVGFDETDKENPVRVWFGKEVDYLVDYEKRRQLGGEYSIEPPPFSKQGENLRTWNYPPKDLLICSAWSMKTLTQRHFKRMGHSYCEPKELFVAGASDCDFEGCMNTTTQRIIFNDNGVVQSADVCDDHSKYNFRCTEEFKYKQRKE